MRVSGTCPPTPSAKKAWPAFGEHGRPDAFGDGHEDGIVDAVEPAEPELGEQAGVGGVVHLDGKLEHLRQLAADVVVLPAEVGSEEQAAGCGVDAARHAHARAFKGLVGVAACAVAAWRARWPWCRSRPRRPANHGAGEEAAVQVDDRDDGLRRAHVGDQEHEVVVQAQHGGPAAASGFDGGAFADPALGEELFHDGGNSAGLQAGDAGYVHAGDGLVRADELQHHVAIDVAGQLSGRDLNIGKLPG